jgi:hypothetical protein
MVTEELPGTCLQKFAYTLPDSRKHQLFTNLTEMEAATVRESVAEAYKQPVWFRLVEVRERMVTRIHAI